LILLTPSPDPGWAAALARLKRRGVASKALLLAHEENQALMPLRLLLARMGVESEIISTLAPLQVEPHTGRASRWEFKVLPTGRAIAVNRPRRTTSP
jgi:hypothetical protein